MDSTTIAAAAKALRRKEVSPVDLIGESIRLADAWEPNLKSLVLRLDDEAIGAAQTAERELASGIDRGPLHGIPLVVKDHLDMVGQVTGAGSKLLINNIASSDAEVIRRLRQAGAVVLAKANTHELAFGAATPPTRNPWDLSRIPGGSSGGSGAAVAAGIVPLAIGTDSGASIREPAAFCGIVGLKPTLGRVSCSGVLPFAWTLDTVGPMAGSAADCDVLLSVIEDDRRVPTRRIRTDDSACIGLPKLIAIPKELVSPLQLDVARAWEALLDDLANNGAAIHHVSVGDVDEVIAALLVIVGSEAFAYQRKWVMENRDLYSAEVLAQVEMGAEYSAADYVDAGRVRRAFSTRVAKLLEDFDVLMTPAQFVVAPRADDEFASFAGGDVRPLVPTLIRPLAPFAMSGHPAVSIPLALGEQTRMPVGAQLVGPADFDHELLAAAGAVQAISDWSFSSPPLPSKNLPGEKEAVSGESRD